ncbi:hypothetical protein EDD15DRAFT_2364272 [Pisolithus albus]|nr:hypothetical protein EDD15DRAFT_2364272 [Pisolithus albus]
MVKAPKPYNAKQSLQLASMGQAIAALQEQMDAFARNQQAKERRRKKSKKYDMLSQSEDLIPRPKGRPARSDGKGYRIIESMGLSNQKELFNYLKHGIRKLANRKLDTSRTLAKQKNKLLVEKVIFQAQVEYKIFQNYENGWPVRDLLAQYLRNSSQQEKRAAAKLKLWDTKHRVHKKTGGQLFTDEEAHRSDPEDSKDDMREFGFTDPSDMDGPNEKGDTSSEERSEAERDSESDEDDVRGRPVKPSGRSRGSRVHGSSGKSKPRPQKRQREERSDAERDNESDEDDDASPVRSRPVKPSGRSEKSRVHGSSGKSKPRPQKRQREERSEAEHDDESDEDDDASLVRSRPVKPSGRSEKSRVHASPGKSKPRPQKRQHGERSEAEHDDESDEDDDASPVRGRPVKPSGRSETSRVHASPSKSKPRPQKRQRGERSEAEHDDESDEDDDASLVRSRPVNPGSSGEIDRRSDAVLTLFIVSLDKISRRPANDQGMLNDSGNRAPKAHPKTTGSSTKITSARQSRESDEDEDEADYHSDIRDGGDPSPSAIIPKTCPEMDCEDPIPDHPSEQLRTALTTYVSLVKQKKTNFRLALDICRLIKREQRRLKAIEFAEEADWPVTRVDFKDIPRRVLKLEDELRRLIFDAEVHKNVFLWKCFEAALEVEGCTISQFARMRSPPMSSMIWQNSRSGYYGSKGTAIVMHMLLQLFPLTTPTDAFQPLSLMQYLSYFVTPHIFCQLIAEDYGGTTTINAQKIMYESSDVGELVNPKCDDDDDDDELDQIKCKTTLALRKRTSDGWTTQDAASTLVALRYSKPTDAPGPSKSNGRPKPRLVLHPPRRAEDTNPDEAVSRANEAPREKPRNQQSENNVPAEAQARPPTEAVNAHFRY